MTQQPLFAPGSANREDVQTCLLSRSTDPITSRQAAKRTREKLSRQHETVLYWVKRYGPGTCREIAYMTQYGDTSEEIATYHVIERRIKALMIAGYVREVGKKDGARVFEAT